MVQKRYRGADAPDRLAMFATTFVAVLIVGIFAWDIGQRWWRETAWRRRWRRRDDDED